MTKRRTVSGDPAYYENKLKIHQAYDTIEKIKKNKILCFWSFLVVTAFLFYLLCVLYLMFRLICLLLKFLRKRVIYARWN